MKAAITKILPHLLMLLCLFPLSGNMEQVVVPSQKVGRQYLVIIAIDQYDSPRWESLEFPVRYSREIEQILNEKYYIDNTFTLYDEKATKTNILNLLDSYMERVLEEEDSVLLFFSGHGTLEEEQGYWIPSDGTGDKAGWIGNRELLTAMGGWKARHVLLIVDSCFSGSILRKKYRGDAQRIDKHYFRNTYAKNSRSVISSGSWFEIVPDNSEFGFQLKNFLLNNKNKYIDCINIFDGIREGVQDTTPELGSFSGGEGSLLLFKKPYSMDMIKEKSSLSLLMGYPGSGLIPEESFFPALRFSAAGKIFSLTREPGANLMLFAGGLYVPIIFEDNLFYLITGPAFSWYPARGIGIDLYAGGGGSIIWGESEGETRQRMFPGAGGGVNAAFQFANHFGFQLSVSSFAFYNAGELLNIFNISGGIKWFF